MHALLKYNKTVKIAICTVCVCRTENILSAVRQFVVSVYQDFTVVWPGLLM